MRARTKKKRRTFSVAALQEEEGAAPKDPESARSHLSPEVGLAAPVERVAVGRSAAFSPRERHPADRGLGAPLVRRGAVSGPPHRALVAPALPARPHDPAAAAPRKRQPRALQGPLAPESRGE